MIAVAIVLALTVPPLPPSDAEPDAVSRMIAAGGASLGALVGGVVGSSAALAAGATLSDVNGPAQALPMFVLPPALAALGAGAGGAVTGGGASGWGAGVAGLLGAGAASVGVGLVLLEEPKQDEGGRFLLAVALPAAGGALAAGLAAALLAE